MSARVGEDEDVIRANAKDEVDRNDGEDRQLLLAESPEVERNGDGEAEHNDEEGECGEERHGQHGEQKHVDRADRDANEDEISKQSQVELAPGEPPVASKCQLDDAIGERAQAWNEGIKIHGCVHFNRRAQCGARGLAADKSGLEVSAQVGPIHRRRCLDNAVEAGCD